MKDKYFKALKYTFIIVIALILCFIGYILWRKAQLIIFPWKTYNEKNCTVKGCYVSEMNQKFTYWQQKALKEKNLALCESAESFELETTVLKKKEAVDLCRMTTAVQLGDKKNCEGLSSHNRGICLLMIGSKIKKPILPPPR